MLNPEFIKKLQEMDQIAYLEFYKQYRNSFIAHFIKNYNLDLGGAEDAFQDLCVRVIQSVHRFSPEDYKYFWRWLLVIADNLGKEIYRKKYKENKLINSALAHQNLISLTSAVQKPTNKDLDQQLRTFILENFCPEDIHILQLSICANYAIKDIAKQLRMNIQTVKTRLLRMRRKVKNFIEKEGLLKKCEPAQTHSLLS